MAAASTELRYARLLKPFPTKRLADALYHVNAESAGISQELQRLLQNPPTTPEPWSDALWRLETALHLLIERCDEVLPVIVRMAEDAEPDFRRAVRAMEAILIGLREAPQEPADVA